MALNQHPFARIDIDAFTRFNINDLKRAQTFNLYQPVFFQAVFHHFEYSGGKTFCLLLLQATLCNQYGRQFLY